MDSEAQKDEILALESIYNDEEFSYHLENEQYEITIKIFLNLPENYFFVYRDSQQDGKDVQKVNISHLPPLTLCVTLPLDYPSTSPPKFVLRSSWLKISLIYKLCKKLDKLWEINKGQEILFTWISFLQSETLEYLHIEKSIDINYACKFYKMNIEKAQKEQDLVNVNNAISAKKDCEENKPNNEKVVNELATSYNQKIKKQPVRRKYKKSKNKRFQEKRAVFDVIMGSNPVKMLIDYNKIRNEIEFRKSFYSCKICFTDKLGEHCTQFLPCTHVFCKDCITGYFESKIKEGSVQNINCPDENCKSEALPNQIKDLISAELFSKYDTILLNATLDTMADIIYCPRKICQYPVSREPQEVMASCPMCEYTFCILCKAVYHGIDPCKINTVEKQLLVKEYQEASAEGKVALELRYGKKQLQLFLENAMSENWIQQNSQYCPKCNAAIEKSDGCNKMVCWKCKTFFCWLCKAKLNKDDPYDHYRNPSSECFSKLYYGMVIDMDDGDDDDFFDDIDDVDLPDLPDLNYYSSASSDDSDDYDFFDSDEFD